MLYRDHDHVGCLWQLNRLLIVHQVPVVIYKFKELLNDDASTDWLIGLTGPLNKECV